MGSSAKPQLPPRRKKKGRPSLLDIQKRSLRLQASFSSSKNPSPSNTNPYLRFPTSSNSRSSSLRRSAPRGQPSPSAASADDDNDEEGEEEGGGSGRRRRERQLKHVLRLSPEVEEEGEGSHRKRKAVADTDRDKVGSNNGNKCAKATDSRQEEVSDVGSTTLLPDKILLVFILDRLQKKDTYEVFSEPVDPEELPDYHDIIEHPMDFGTVREKLSSGKYANLEQFEKDVFLISSNAMHYNAPDTIYFRQARAIHELAKKNFDNLRQESEDNGTEAKTVVRRGRPPNKFKKVPGRPSDRAGSDFSSDATLANAAEHCQLSKADKTGSAEAFTWPSHSETVHGLSEQNSDRNDDFSGFSLKGYTKYGKRPVAVDESRRNTYKQNHWSTAAYELSARSIFDGEKKFLVPVGIHMEHACARSIARFAANFDPIGWSIAARRLQRILPLGTDFGPGWVGVCESLPKTQQPLFSTSPGLLIELKQSPSSMTKSGNDNLPQRQEASSNENEIEGHSNRTPQSVLSPAASNMLSDTLEEGSLAARSSVHENGGMAVEDGGDNLRPHAPLYLGQKQGIHPAMNGFNMAINFNLSQHLAKMSRPMQPPTGFPEVQIAHAHALGNLSLTHQRNVVHQVGEDSRPVENSTNSTVQRKESAPPVLNIGTQTLGSPSSGVFADPQQQQHQKPDLAL